MDSDSPTDEIEDDYQFLDALDDFPFYDCLSDDQFDARTSEPSTSSLHRRKLSRRGISAGESEVGIIEFGASEDSSIPSSSGSKSKGNDEISEVNDSNPERVNPFRVKKEENDGGSTITTAKNDVSAKSSSRDELRESISSSSSSSNFLTLIPKLVIKASGFQFNSLISLITLPIKLSYFCYLIFFNPFQAILYIFNPFKVLRRIRNYVLRYSWNAFCGYVKSCWNLMFGGGLFCAAYLCCVLFGLFILSLMVSWILMRSVMVEPIKIQEILNFDYTKNDPVAFLPISSCPGMEKKIEVPNSFGSRILPPDHRLQVTVSLTLPESENNRNLGVFQVRVDFLADNGTVLVSSTQPGMLGFRSKPIRGLLTFLQAAPLLTGFISESQALNLKIRGVKEGNVPTSCLSVTIEQRAEVKPGAGIPELYSAFIVLESDLSLFKRVLWYWKKTIFVWISMASFVTELLVVLICRRSIFFPKSRSAAQNQAIHR